MGNGALATGPKLPRPSSTLPDRRFAALHNSGSSTPTSGRHAQVVIGCSRARRRSLLAAQSQGLASVRVRRDHSTPRPPLLTLIAAPFSSRLSRHNGERRATGAPAKGKVPDRPDDTGQSFADDWKALGSMLCRLLGVVVDAAGSIGPEAGGAMPNLTAGELRWLRRVCRPRAREALEAHALARACDDIVVEVGSAAGQREGRCTLLIPRSGGALAEAVLDASGGKIAADERRAQRDFVNWDLDGGATLYAPRTGDEEARRLYLVSQRMGLTVQLAAAPKSSTSSRSESGT